MTNSPHQPLQCRPRWVAKWAAILLMLLLIAMWVLSGWRQVARVQITPECWFGITGGDATLSYWAHDPAVGFRLGPHKPEDVVADVLNEILKSRSQSWWQRGRWSWSLPRVWYRRGPSDTEAGVMLPAWTVFIALASTTVLLWYRDRRSVRWAGAGRCAGCGYDLSGLAKGSACPECGKGGSA